MDKSLGIIGIFVGAGLLLHGGYSYLRCDAASILQYLLWDCSSIILQAEFEVIIGLALCGGSILALVAATDVEKPPKNPPLYHP